MCGAPANSVGWVDPGVMHVAKLTGLTPGQMYYYRFGDEVSSYSWITAHGHELRCTCGVLQGMLRLVCGA